MRSPTRYCRVRASRGIGSATRPGGVSGCGQSERPRKICLARVPVVYRLNLRVGNGYFLAQSFPMRDKDVILLANADGAQLLKFFVLLRGPTGAFHDLGLGYLGFSSAGAKQVPAAITGTP